MSRDLTAEDVWNSEWHGCHLVRLRDNRVGIWRLLWPSRPLDVWNLSLLDSAIKCARSVIWYTIKWRLLGSLWLHNSRVPWTVFTRYLGFVGVTAINSIKALLICCQCVCVCVCLCVTSIFWWNLVYSGSHLLFYWSFSTWIWVTRFLLEFSAFILDLCLTLGQTWTSFCPVRALKHSAPLIHWLISTLRMLFACVLGFPHLFPFFLTYFT